MGPGSLSTPQTVPPPPKWPRHPPPPRSPWMLHRSGHARAVHTAPSAAHAAPADAATPQPQPAPGQSLSPVPLAWATALAGLLGAFVFAVRRAARPDIMSPLPALDLGQVCVPLLNQSQPSHCHRCPQPRTMCCPANARCCCTGNSVGTSRAPCPAP